MHLFVYANGDGKEGIMNRDAIYRIELHLTARIGEGEQRSVRSRRGASGRRVEKVEQTFTRVLEALPKATFARRACRGFTVDDPQVETWSDTPPPPPPFRAETSKVEKREMKRDGFGVRERDILSAESFLVKKFYSGVCAVIVMTILCTDRRRAKTEGTI